MMDKPKRDVSMIVFAAAGEQLISATIALALVRMVIEEYYGKSELAAQEPLKVEDGGNVWSVSGSRVRQPYDRGPIKATVSKLDAAIVSFTIWLKHGAPAEGPQSTWQIWQAYDALRTTIDAKHVATPGKRRSARLGQNGGRNEKVIVRDEYGRAELDRNEPLSTDDEGKAWLVSGSMSKASSDSQEPGWAGPISVRISKFDGQIIDYMHTLLPE